MKKLLAILTSAVLMLGMTACGTQESSAPESSSKSDSKESTSMESSSSTSTESSSDTSTESSTPESSSAPEESSADSETSSPADSKPEEVKPDEKKYDLAFWETVPEADEADFTYEIVQDGVEITEYNGENKDVKIPKTIDGDPVVGIDLRNSKITGLYIPDEVNATINLQYNETIKRGGILAAGSIFIVILVHRT